MPSPVDTILQSGADFVNGFPDWFLAVLVVVLVIGIPILFCWVIGDDDNV